MSVFLDENLSPLLVTKNCSRQNHTHLDPHRGLKVPARMNGKPELFKDVTYN